METPAKAVKAQGVRSLSKLSDVSGVPIRTIESWHRSRPKLFQLILDAAKEAQKNPKDDIEIMLASSFIPSAIKLEFLKACIEKLEN